MDGRDKRCGPGFADPAAGPRLQAQLVDRQRCSPCSSSQELAEFQPESQAPGYCERLSRAWPRVREFRPCFVGHRPATPLLGSMVCPIPRSRKRRQPRVSRAIAVQIRRQESLRADHECPPSANSAHGAALWRRPRARALVHGFAMLHAGAQAWARTRSAWLKHGRCGSTAVGAVMHRIAPLASNRLRSVNPRSSSPPAAARGATISGSPENGLLTTETEIAWMPGLHQG